MSARISYRKGGEEEFKEITDKPQFMELDDVAPPEAEEYDPNEIIEFQREINHQRSVDGDGTPLNNDERV